MWSPKRLRPIRVMNGSMEAAQQPHALVVEADVEGAVAVAPVDVGGQVGEVEEVPQDGEAGDGDAEHAPEGVVAEDPVVEDVAGGVSGSAPSVLSGSSSRSAAEPSSMASGSSTRVPRLGRCVGVPSDSIVIELGSWGEGSWRVVRSAGRVVSLPASSAETTSGIGPEWVSG